MRHEVQPTLLRELLRYDSETGILHWKERLPKHFSPSGRRSQDANASWWNGRFAGKRACKSDCNRGYLRVCINGSEFPAHRIIWALVYGFNPPDAIDHINGDVADNRLSNLRMATTAENNRNRASFGKSKYRGVSWRARQNTWVAAIKTDKKVTFLGLFKDEAEAARTYDVAAISHHGKFARLNFPQADYDARIRSALVDAPVDPVKVAETARCLSVVKAMQDGNEWVGDYYPEIAAAILAGKGE